MEILAEIIGQFVGEIVLQALFELLAEMGVRSLAAPFRRPRHPVWATIGFTLWGITAGAISVWVFPESPIHNPLFRRMNLVVTPVAVGFLMTFVGKIRLKKGQELMRLDRFGFAFVFAFAMALIRFIWAV
ncbi:MAG TPA: hypothetical protein VKI45_10560 [Allosphingosinicella sp.]|nr:hypothetical protein [Allosphingosinicella sp.]